MTLNTLPTPCLLLDQDRLTKNCERMRAHVASVGVRLRPHLKTLKSIDVARLAMDESNAITVSTLHEAEYFAANGVHDITCAVCLPPHKLRRALILHRRMEGPGLGLLVESLHVARAMVELATRENATLAVWIEIDCGEHRTGVDARSDELLSIARMLSVSPAIDFRGVLTHAGHSYRCTNVDEIQAVADAERTLVVLAAERVREAGIACPGVSAGSSPTAKHGKDWRGVTELRPGVYMVGDLLQEQLGVSARADLALTVLASVISHRREIGRLVIDAGGLALSKDRSMRGRSGDPVYGEVLAEDGSELGLCVIDVHQEHGEIDVPIKDVARIFEALPIGSHVRVLPNHACMTAAGYDRYHLVRSGAQAGVWLRTNGWD